ncbi:MAG TPA: amidophosphoribosyltransferase [Candidatus Limiplasma sp.]|nr:amidophosphoribosyltransferase [Candidatus Limiplasma sp.]HPS81090.1 amidophosphoribosyltransferase [Candidatus Limiplasma sp.]
MSKLHEECGVFGVFLPNGQQGVVHPAYHALYALQHRGQESCGIAVNNDGVIDCHKDVGLVGEVFTRDVMEKLTEGSIAVGHCRYGTTGAQNRGNAQPLLVNHLKGGMALCHNGNLVNAHELRDKLERGGAIFHTTSDSEVIAYTVTQERLTAESIEQAVLAAMKRIQGAYSLVVMSPSKLVAARDPHGFRPLCMGALENGGTVFASESCALDAIGAAFVRDIRPGEVVVVDQDGIRSLQLDEPCKSALCVFEFIYFARPDSVIDGSAVHTARLRAGAFLALEHPVQADVVIGVPDSGIDAAIGYARQSGIPYGVGFIKNRYVGRTFIQPGQQARQNAVRIKLNAVRSTVAGKRVVLIDDSIVRGTTSARIVSLLREAGATEVHMRLSSPPFRHPCYFGTDIDSTDHLIAANHTVEEIRTLIGADSLGYLPVECLDKLADHSSCGFCKGCFTGSYPVEPPRDASKNKFETHIGQNRRDAEGEGE